MHKLDMNIQGDLQIHCFCHILYVLNPSCIFLDVLFPFVYASHLSSALAPGGPLCILQYEMSALDSIIYLLLIDQKTCPSAKSSVRSCVSFPFHWSMCSILVASSTFVLF